VKKQIGLYLFTLLYVVDIGFIGVGIVASIMASYRPGATLTDDIFSTFFWAANIFFGIQSIAYILNFRRSKTFYPITKENSLNISVER